jgi:hypothetical protein
MLREVATREAFKLAMWDWRLSALSVYKPMIVPQPHKALKVKQRRGR